MGTKNFSYDHAAYQARSVQTHAQNSAGASTNFAKFVAFTAMKVFAIGVKTLTAGTSTYTAWNGTATVSSIVGDTIHGLRVSGTTTSTYGPYLNDAAAGSYRRVQIYGTGAGSATADGGIDLAQGDHFYLVRGTDATAVVVPVFEYALAPLADVTA